MRTRRDNRKIVTTELSFIFQVTFSLALSLPSSLLNLPVDDPCLVSSQRKIPMSNLLDNLFRSQQKSRLASIFLLGSRPGREAASWERGWKTSPVLVTLCMITMKAKLTTLEISVIKKQVVTSFSRELSWPIGRNKGVHFPILFVQVFKHVLCLKLKLKSESKLVNFYFVPVNLKLPKNK